MRETSNVLIGFAFGMLAGALLGGSRMVFCVVGIAAFAVAFICRIMWVSRQHPGQWP